MNREFQLGAELKPSMAGREVKTTYTQKWLELDHKTLNSRQKIIVLNRVSLPVKAGKRNDYKIAVSLLLTEIAFMPKGDDQGQNKYRRKVSET